MAHFIRTIALAVLVAIAGWWTMFLRGKFTDHDRQLAERDERIVALEGDVAERDETIRAQELALHLLKVDERVARVVVLEQSPHPDDPSRVRTRVRFNELDGSGHAVDEGREIVVEGDTLYLDALVIKFEDDFVEAGDALRGTSVCLFRRAFGEDQRPAEGTPLDAVGLQPGIYAAGDDEASLFHQELWQNFWDYANDPERAAEMGIRAVHGEAPFMQLRPGAVYRVELRSSGGLTISPE